MRVASSGRRRAAMRQGPYAFVSSLSGWLRETGGHVLPQRGERVILAHADHQLILGHGKTKRPGAVGRAWAARGALRPRWRLPVHQETPAQTSSPGLPACARHTRRPRGRKNACPWQRRSTLRPQRSTAEGIGHTSGRGSRAGAALGGGGPPGSACGA